MAFIGDEDGATAVEYGLMITVVSATIVASLGFIGDSLSTIFGVANDAFPVGK